jgi:hypothetical protein
MCGTQPPITSAMMVGSPTQAANIRGGKSMGSRFAA